MGFREPVDGLTCCCVARNFRALFPDENVFCQSQRNPAQVVGHRRPGPGAGKGRYKSSESVAWQREDRFHIACGYGRFCDRYQCGKSATYREKRRTKELHEFFRLRRWT